MNLHDRDITRMAKREGAEEKAIETAANLLKMNTLSFEQIAQATGLSLEKILEIKNKKMVIA